MLTRPWSWLRRLVAPTKPPRVHRAPLTVAEWRAGIRPDDAPFERREERRPRWITDNDLQSWRGHHRRVPWGEP